MRAISTGLLVMILGVLGLASPAHGQSAADTAAIKQTALDYVEGWYEGNAERMGRALSSDLAKRNIVKNPQTGNDTLEQMSKAELVKLTGEGIGKKTPRENQQKDVTILDYYGGMASVKVVFADWVDYLHVAKIDGRWVIVNVLWEFKPKAKQK